MRGLTSDSCRCGLSHQLTGGMTVRELTDYNLEHSKPLDKPSLDIIRKMKGLSANPDKKPTLKDLYPGAW